MIEIEKMLYAVLSEDDELPTLAPGGVWRGVAPVDKPAGTWVVFTLISELDEYTFASRALVECYYQVKAITPGESAADAHSAAARIETLLTDATPTMSSGSIKMIRRQQAISITETDGGEQYQHVGGIYAITVQE
jgi:hypothetical protein